MGIEKYRDTLSQLHDRYMSEVDQLLYVLDMITYHKKFPLLSPDMRRRYRAMSLRYEKL
jgi:hypothetical protein